MNISNILASRTSVLPYAQIGLTALLIAWVILYPQSGGQWGLSVLMYCLIGGLGISVGYHRLLTHRSFKTNRAWEIVCTLAGALAFTGSSIGWVGVHKDHHKHSDRDGDPHSPHKLGLKMLIALYLHKPDKWRVRHLITDRFHIQLHKYYFGWLALWAAFVFVVGGATGLMHLVLIPATLSIWSSTLSNYMNHKWGYATYSGLDESKNNWLNAIFTFGEGWHNNHHAHPSRYRFGEKWYELDAGARVVELIKR